MFRIIRLPHAVLALLLLAGLAAAHAAEPLSPADMARIEQLTGLKGAYSSDEQVFKVGKPRADVKVEVNHWAMPPFMGLVSWASFMRTSGGQALLMGDTVLFEDEVNPAMSAALEAGLEVTALHNHFFFDEPHVYFMHLGGTGTLDQLASGVKKVYDRIAEIRKAQPAPASAFPGAMPKTSSITPGPLETIFGVKGVASEGMFKVTLGRGALMRGVVIGKEMGVSSWAAFAGTDAEAVVDGDIVMSREELQPTLKSLRAAGINVTAIHQHMTGEQPRLFFLHYWGMGRAQDLARALMLAWSRGPAPKQHGANLGQGESALALSARH